MHTQIDRGTATLEGVPPRQAPLRFRAAPEPARAPPEPVRLASVEAARVLSSVNVVVCHVIGMSVGGAFLLTALSMALTVRAHRRASLFKERARRLLMPWLFWSALYLAAPVIHALRHGEPVSGAFKPSMLLVGGADHLWYLPFAFVMTVLASYAISAVNGGAAWAIAGAALLVFTGASYGSLGGGLPLSQWLLGASAVMFGVSMKSSKPGSLGLLKPLATVAAAWIAAAAAYLAGGLPVALPAAVGTALLCVVWSARARSPAWLTYCAGLGYGVYLLHPAVLWFVRPMGLGSILTVASAVAISGLASALIRRTSIGGLPLKCFM